MPNNSIVYIEEPLRTKLQKYGLSFYIINHGHYANNQQYSQGLRHLLSITIVKRIVTLKTRQTAPTIIYTKRESFFSYSRNKFQNENWNQTIIVQVNKSSRQLVNLDF